MNESFVRWILIPLVVLIVSFAAQFIRRKLAKPAYQGEVQTPGKFDQRILTLFKVLTAVPAFILLVGFLVQEKEMLIVSTVILIIFIGIIFFLKREYDMSYQENEEFFLLTVKNIKIQMYYDDIVDWLPGMNEISLLDRTRDDQKYINVNISMLKPEILLRQIAQKTFDGSFPRVVDDHFEDPNREQELINFYELYGYGYLLPTDVLKAKNENDS